MELAKGRYVIIPYTETIGYSGPFTIAVSASNKDDLDLYKIPKSADADWNTLRVAVY